MHSVLPYQTDVPEANLCSPQCHMRKREREEKQILKAPTSFRHTCIVTVLKKEQAPYDSSPVNRNTEKLAPSATHSWTMTHSGTRC